MPYYQFICKECGEELNIQLKMTENLPKNHVQFKSKCNGKLEQKLSPPLLNFVGSGFYVNDYKKK